MVYSNHQESSSDNGCLPPWEAYHRAIHLAHAARGQYLRGATTTFGHDLRDRICTWARAHHFRFCPLCC
jgi:hypothetical protein